MFIALLLLWIIFNANFTVEILLFGIVISGAVCVFLSKFAGYSFKDEIRRLPVVPQLLVYIPVLVWEIIKANFAVVRMVYKGQKPLNPVFVHFKTGLRTEFARTLLANSITLTPGTITVSMHEDEFTVHCLDSSLAEGITTSCFVKRLERMEERL